jgi:hypothetical protein
MILACRDVLVMSASHYSVGVALLMPSYFGSLTNSLHGILNST